MAGSDAEVNYLFPLIWLDHQISAAIRLTFHLPPFTIPTNWDTAGTPLTFAFGELSIVQHKPCR